MFVFREAGGSHTVEVDDGRDESLPASAAQHRTTVLRISVPTPFGWYFCNIRLGRERRSLSRLIDEGQLSFAKLSLSYTLVIWLLLGFIGLGVMVGIYLVKSFAGIDLFPGASFLHDFVYRR